MFLADVLEKFNKYYSMILRSFLKNCDQNPHHEIGSLRSNTSLDSDSWKSAHVDQFANFKSLLCQPDFNQRSCSFDLKKKALELFQIDANLSYSMIAHLYRCSKM